MNFDDIDVSQVMNKVQEAVDYNQERIASSIIAEHKYKGHLEDCIFDTRDTLLKMQEDSAKDHKWLIIGTTASVIAAIGTVVSIIISLI